MGITMATMSKLFEIFEARGPEAAAAYAAATKEPALIARASRLRKEAVSAGAGNRRRTIDGRIVGQTGKTARKRAAKAARKAAA